MHSAITVWNLKYVTVIVVCSEHRLLIYRDYPAMLADNVSKRAEKRPFKKFIEINTDGIGQYGQ